MAEKYGEKPEKFTAKFFEYILELLQVVYNSFYSGNRTWRIYCVSDKKHTSL